MIFRLAADAVLALHLAFILFAVLGALLAARWRRVIPVHVAAASWAVYVEVSGRVCPLTPLENHFRLLAGQSGYAGGFVERYLLNVIYPDGLTRNIQFLLAVVVLFVNLGIYAWIFLHPKRRRSGAA